MKAPTRWGFIGAGFVATHALAPAVHAAQESVLQVVAAREPERAAHLEPNRTAATYLDVIEADDVDAVYISVTNEAHEQWVLKALASGKHVLCEKPLAMSAESVALMQAAAQSADRLLIEALWYRWHPRFARTIEVLRHGAVGSLTSIESRFCFTGVPAGNYRLDPHKGGGALLDVGPYTLDAALSSVRAVTGKPDAATVIGEHTVIRADRDGVGSVDLSVDTQVSLDDVHVALAVSLDRTPEQRFTVTGDAGALAWPGQEVFTVWNTPCELTITDETGSRTESFEAVDAYQLMIEQCGRAIRGLEPAAMSPHDSLVLARLIDQVATA